MSVKNVSPTTFQTKNKQTCKLSGISFENRGKCDGASLQKNCGTASKMLYSQFPYKTQQRVPGTNDAEASKIDLDFA